VGFLAGLTVWAHMFGVFTVAAQILALALGLVVRRPRRLRGPLVGLGACAITAAPLLAISLGHGQDLIWWIPRPKPSAIPYTFAQLAGAGSSSVLAWVVFALAVLALVVCRRWGTVLAASLLAVPLLGAYLVSVLSSPIFVVRYLLGALPGLVLLVAGGLGRLRWVGAIGAVVLVLVSASLIDLRAPVEEWRAVTNDVLASSQPGDGIAFFHPAGHCVFDYYAGGRGPTVVFPRLTSGQTLFDEHASILVPLEAAEARAAVAGHKRIWVVYAHAGATVQQRHVFRSELDRRGLRYRTQRHYRGILLLLFARSDALPAVSQLDHLD
jgi:hypothetical protein